MKNKVVIWKNLPVKDFAADVYLFDAQDPISPPLHTVYVYTAHIFIHTGKGGGGGESWTREEFRGAKQFKKLGRKYQHDWLYL